MTLEEKYTIHNDKISILLGWVESGAIAMIISCLIKPD